MSDKVTIEPTSAEFKLETSLQKLKGKKRAHLQYAVYKWEFLRRNDDFKNDVTKYPVLPTKWNWEDSLPKNLECSAAEIIQILSPIHTTYLDNEGATIVLNDFESFHKAAVNWERDLRKSAINVTTQMFIGDEIATKIKNSSKGDLFNKYYKSFMECEEFRKTGILNISVDLKHSKSKLTDQFKNIIDRYSDFLYKSDKEENSVRSKHYYDLYPLYINVYDMRKRGVTFKEIAKTVTPDSFDTDPKGAETKVMQHYKEVKRIIDNVDKF